MLEFNYQLVRTNSISETLGIVDKQLITKVIITQKTIIVTFFYYSNFNFSFCSFVNIILNGSKMINHSSFL